MERFCRRCNKDVAEPFCPDCGGLTVSKGLIRQSGTSRKGERFEATIWSGEELGIRIGVNNRDKYFSRKNACINCLNRCYLSLINTRISNGALMPESAAHLMNFQRKRWF